MRLSCSLVRLFVVLAMAGITALLSTPTAVAEPPFRVQDRVTDNAGVLSGSQEAEVNAAVDKLFKDRQIKLWVVYVKTFDGQGRQAWTEQTEKLSDFGTNDALLAVATEDRAYTFSADQSVVSVTQRGNIEREKIEPALRSNQWAAAATGAANGLNSYNSPSSEPSSGQNISAKAIWIAVAALVLLAVVLWWWTHRRRGRRNKAELEAAKRVDPTDAQALAAVPLEALDELSKQIVVDVDNAVRTSTNELELATEEFGAVRVAPFAKAVTNAKTALAEAFNVRQTLDDDVPESPLQKRQLLTKVITSAGAADRELEAQQHAFGEMRNVLINAPERLGSMTQQMVALTARLDPGSPGAGRAAPAVRRRRAGLGRRQCRPGPPAADVRRRQHHQGPRPDQRAGAGSDRAVRHRPCGRGCAAAVRHPARRRRQRRHRHQPGHRRHARRDR